jgi:hypothetical protein
MGSFLKSFVIGSNAFVTVPKLLGVSKFTQNVDKKYTYEDYSIFMPISYGLVAVSANLMRQKLNISLFNSIFILYILFGITQYILVRKWKVYNFTPKQWKKYFVTTTIISHALVYGVIYLLEKYIP